MSEKKEKEKIGERKGSEGGEKKEQAARSRRERKEEVEKELKGGEKREGVERKERSEGKKGRSIYAAEGHIDPRSKIIFEVLWQLSANGVKVNIESLGKVKTDQKGLRPPKV
ncbi:hypothetical protein Tco_1416904 [Tanacetum coccineum]